LDKTKIKGFARLGNASEVSGRTRDRFGTQYPHHNHGPSHLRNYKHSHLHTLPKNISAIESYRQYNICLSNHLTGWQCRVQIPLPTTLPPLTDPGPQKAPMPALCASNGRSSVMAKDPAQAASKPGPMSSVKIPQLSFDGRGVVPQWSVILQHD
jgi:hypothetical protein